jgi:hypothetical protein
MNWQDEQKTIATGVTDGPAHRNAVLEEVAKEIERFTFAFGVDTVHSFAAFVRSMKD